jgi:DNA-binding transcriptional ArsR family regulator
MAKNNRHDSDISRADSQAQGAASHGVVLDKVIFSNVFDKDIRRVYQYKKAERLAKAMHLVAPAFKDASALRDRLEQAAVALIDAALLPPAESRARLCRELLALSSLLSLGRTAGMISHMNADLIMRETQMLLEEVAGYEEPHLALEEAPSLALLAKQAGASDASRLRSVARLMFAPELGATGEHKGHDKRHIKDIAAETPSRPQNQTRREAILAVLRSKDHAYIKDISTVIRDVSEKTIQRELASLVTEGKVVRAGDRRWTTYALARND